MSNSLQPHELLHIWLPCPSLSARVCSNSCPLSWLCYLTISSSVISFSFCPQSFPASGSFPMSWLFTSDGHSFGNSASVRPMNIHSWFPLGLTGLISLQSTGISRVFSSTTIQNLQFFGAQPSLWSSSHICTWLLENCRSRDFLTRLEWRVIICRNKVMEHFPNIGRIESFQFCHFISVVLEPDCPAVLPNSR